MSDRNLEYPDADFVSNSSLKELVKEAHSMFTSIGFKANYKQHKEEYAYADAFTPGDCTYEYKELHCIYTHNLLCIVVTMNMAKDATYIELIVGRDGGKNHTYYNAGKQGDVCVIALNALRELREHYILLHAFVTKDNNKQL